ncbi:MAG: hypothetical protein R2848_18380 [Thermomicrobiales bacterium]
MTSALAQLRLFDEGLLVKATALDTGVDAIEAGEDGVAAAVTAQIAELKASLATRQCHRQGPAGQAGERGQARDQQPRRPSTTGRPRCLSVSIFRSSAWATPCLSWVTII